MSRSPFLGLDEAAHLIASLIRKSRPSNCPSDASALEEGRRQLVRALSDGVVHAQGILHELPPPPPPDQDGPFPVPSFDEPKKIPSTWWSNDRYEKVSYAKPRDDFGIEWKWGAGPLEVASKAIVAEDADGSLNKEEQADSGFATKHQMDQGDAAPHEVDSKSVDDENDDAGPLEVASKAIVAEDADGSLNKEEQADSGFATKYQKDQGDAALHTVDSKVVVTENADGLLNKEEETDSGFPIEYQIDQGIINWSDDSFKIDENYDSDWFISCIRILRCELELSLSVGDLLERADAEKELPNTRTDNHHGLRPIEASGESAAGGEISPISALEGRRRGRPADIRNKVHEWLDEQLRDDGATSDRPDTVLAHMYCSDELQIKDKNDLEKCVGANRKHVATWKRGRDLKGTE